MLEVLNLSLTELVNAAENNKVFVLNGEEYRISNMVFASEPFATKAKIIMTSTTCSSRKFELDLSAKFNNGYIAR